jgi:dTDP-4-dehydrorhamnose reductase
VNGVGSINLALVCNELDKPLLHIGTDYVFDGKKGKPYIESDKPLPLNVYGNTKLSGEHFIESMAKKYYILRVSGIYGKNPCLAKGGMNFVDLMLKLAKEREEVRVVDDEVLTPTFTEDIAAQIVKLAHADPEYGLYHCTAESRCSWYEFAKEIFSLTKSSVTLNKAAPGEFAIKVNRPKYSVLENKFLKDQNLNFMPPWQDGLKRYLQIKYDI